MDWFERLFGFREGTPDENRARLRVDGERMTSLVNGATFAIGRFEAPRVAELRARAAALPARPGGRFSHVAVGDVLRTHGDPEEHGSVFQAASQMNALEFVGPEVLPEHGVTGYAGDPTQGPACALAAAPATLWRHLYLPVPGAPEPGQSAAHQLDLLADLRAALGPAATGLLVRNGYTFAAPGALERIRARLGEAPAESWTGAVRVAVHGPVQVVYASRWAPAEPEQRVVQVYTAAPSVGYDRWPAEAWEPLAPLVLDAMFEGALLAAALAPPRPDGTRRVWLTRIGGGVFRNDPRWIDRALARAVVRTAHLGLDVRLAHFRSVDGPTAAAVDRAIEVAGG